MRELSKKNPYYVNVYRYKELVYFCRQYPMWEKALTSLSNLYAKPTELGMLVQTSRGGANVVERCAISIDFFKTKMKIVEDAAKETDPELCDYLLKGITQGLSYDKLGYIPCCRDTYYDRYRKFFYYLNKIQNDFLLR